MERIIIQKFVNDETGLHQFDARKVLSRVLNVPVRSVFPLPEGKEAAISLSIGIRDTRDRGILI